MCVCTTHQIYKVLVEYIYGFNLYTSVTDYLLSLKDNAECMLPKFDQSVGTFNVESTLGNCLENIDLMVITN